MKVLIAAFLALTLSIPTAIAREWQSASGAVFDVYMLQTIENEDDQFLIFALYHEAEDETSRSEVVQIADLLFEETVIHVASQRGQRTAVIRLSTPGEVAEGELPDILADVRYETITGEIWERVSHLDIPEGVSPLFPSEPTSDVTLSNGDVVQLEPVTTLFDGENGSESLNIRIVYPFFVAEGAFANEAMQMIWDEVARNMAIVQDVNRVSVAIYNRPPTSRFDYRQALAGVFTKEPSELWPTYAQMDGE